MINLLRPPVKLQRHLEVFIKTVSCRGVEQHRSKFRALIHLQLFHQQQHILGDLISFPKLRNRTVVPYHLISHRQIQPVIVPLLCLFQHGKHKRLHLLIFLRRKKLIQFPYKFICCHMVSPIFRFLPKSSSTEFSIRKDFCRTAALSPAF